MRKRYLLSLCFLFFLIVSCNRGSSVWKKIDNMDPLIVPDEIVGIDRRKNGV